MAPSRCPVDSLATASRRKDHHDRPHPSPLPDSRRQLPPAVGAHEGRYARRATPTTRAFRPSAGEAPASRQGFFAALFDLSFRTFITRRLASVFYLVGLIAIGIGFLVYFVSGIMGAIRSCGSTSAPASAGWSRRSSSCRSLTFLAIIVLRFIIEAVVALIAIAENTERTAQHTRR